MPLLLYWTCGDNNWEWFIELFVAGFKTLLFWKGENFALGKPARQSTTTHGGVASRAVDGKSTKYYSSGTCTRTDQETSPWWRVDLGQRVAVTRVKIVNRQSYGKRLCGFEIRIGDSLANYGTTNMRCGTRRHIPNRQVRDFNSKLFFLSNYSNWCAVEVLFLFSYEACTSSWLW